MRTPNGFVVALLLGWLTLGPGCAVMTVDVDVYKGPLANHRDVQIQQVAAMAASARPILVRLRYALEKYERDKLVPYRTLEHSNCASATPRKADDGNGTALIDTDKLLDCTDWIPPGKLLSHKAKLVNRVLAEYADRAEYELASTFAPGGCGSSPTTLPVDCDSIHVLNQSVRAARAELCGEAFFNAQEQVRLRGRELGLDTIMRLYARAKARDGMQHGLSNGLVPEPRYITETAYLFGALIHFAEQVKFVANTDVLFGEHEGALNIACSITGATVLGGSDANTTMNSYVLVLQTVGNTILVNIDEIHQQFQHDANLQHGVARELAARNWVYSRSPYLVLEDVIKYLFAKKSQALTAHENAVRTKHNADTAVADMQLAAKDPATVAKSKTALERARTEATRAGGLEQNAAEELRHASEACNAVVDAGLDLLPKQVKPEDYPSPAETFRGIYRALQERRTAAKKLPVAPIDNSGTKPLGLTSQPRFQPASRPTTQPATQPTEADGIQYAISALNAYSPDSLSFVDSRERPDNAKDVLDGVIALLREQHIDAVNRLGPNDNRTKNIEAALDVAYAHRTDMIYIRPTSAYLRTSFPATSLQRDASLGWKNMLTEEQFRQIPFYDAFQDRQYLKTVQVIDKQNWQNINTVRVSGAGDSNYVVVKDDIGNWYIKNFYGDPKDIIESAKNLALFSLGPALSGANLAKQVSASPSTQPAALGHAGAGSGTPSTQPTALGQEFANEQAKYDKATLQDEKDVLSAARGLDSTVQTAWDSDASLAQYKANLKAVLDAQKEIHLASLPSEPPDPAKDPQKAASAPLPADQIVDALQQMRRFHNGLLQAIPTTMPTKSANPAQALKDAQAAKQKADDDAAAAQKCVDADTTARTTAKAELDNAIAAAAKADSDLKAAGNDDTSPAVQQARTVSTNAHAEQTKSQKKYDDADAKLTADHADLTKKQGIAANADSGLKLAQADNDIANAAKAAQQTVSAVVRQTITKYTNQRQAVLGRYDTAVQIIGEAVSTRQK